jgi:hypothetical protein
MLCVHVIVRMRQRAKFLTIIVFVEFNIIITHDYAHHLNH